MGWKKILYEDQGVADNYTDKSFLDELRKNVNTRTYEFWPTVAESGVITQHTSSVCLFTLAYVYMSGGLLSPHVVLVGCAVIYFFTWISTKERDFSHLRMLAAFTFSGYAVSPVLSTLTRSISTDTIYAMTTLMLLSNILFHDYSADAPISSQPISLNCAVFASVCLASRLQSHLHTFALLVLAVVVFAQRPRVRRDPIDIEMSQVPPGKLHVLATVLLNALSTVTIGQYSVLLAGLYAVFCLFVTFLCPAWLISLQPSKNTIHGPWDEAEIKE